MPQTRIGIIGASAFGMKQHIASLRQFSDVELAAVADVIPEKRETCAQEYGIPSQFGTHTAMLDKADLDAVYVIMAPHRSYDVLHDCIQRGMPTFVEKPATLNAHQADRLAELAAASGARTMVAFNRRFMPPLLAAREQVLATGPLNQVVVRYYKRQPETLYYDGAAHFFSTDAIHAVDAIRWLGGETRSVKAVTACHNAKRFNAVHAILTFENGAHGVLMVNWAAGARMHTFELHTLGCSAYVDMDDRVVTLANGAAERHAVAAAEMTGSDDPRVIYGFEAENRYFIDCVKAKREPEPNMAEAARSHRLVEEILHAARQ